MHHRNFIVTPTSFIPLPPIPRVWQLNTDEYWLAPTLEQAIRCSMALCGVGRNDVYEAGYGLTPIVNEELAAMPFFYDDEGNPRCGLEVYRELVANGATVQPFAANGEM